jgi:serine/threonine protein kinase
MGIVYRALDTKLNRLVAIKVLPPEALADPARKKRFAQELGRHRRSIIPPSSRSTTSTRPMASTSS